MIAFASDSLGSYQSMSAHTIVLTCPSKSLYTLLTSHEPINLENTDIGFDPLCGATSKDTPDWGSRWRHRQECHKLSYEAVCKRNKSLGRSTPEMKKKCRTRWSSNHCECYTRRMRLHLRLKGWMPKSLNYCGTCGKFTKRKRGHNGRCEFLSHTLPSILLEVLLEQPANNRSYRLSRTTQRKKVWKSFLDSYLTRRSFRT